MSMSVRTDQHRVADHDGVLSPASHDRVLHHDNVAADDHPTTHRVDDCEVEDSRPSTDRDVAVQDGVR